tara:strand:- start:529 stop:630 length:102 start_codon:yes stop_codon:yes gene_type:complete
VDIEAMDLDISGKMKQGLALLPGKNTRAAGIHL